MAGPLQGRRGKVAPVFLVATKAMKKNNSFKGGHFECTELS